MILVLRSFVIAIAVLTPSAALTTPAWESKPSTLFGLVIVAGRGVIARQIFLPGGRCRERPPWRSGLAERHGGRSLQRLTAHLQRLQAAQVEVRPVLRWPSVQPQVRQTPQERLEDDAPLQPGQGRS